jgi:WD40-like Beta Propeller Repeat
MLHLGFPTRLVLMVALLFGCTGNRAAEHPSSAPAPAPAPEPEPAAVSPTLFLPEVVSQPTISRGYVTLAPDGNTLYASRYEAWGSNGRTTIEVSRLEHGTWSPLRTAPFSGVEHDHMPYVSPDGRYVYFTSKRPVGGIARDDFEIWRVPIAGDGWGEPEHLAELGSPQDEYGPAPTRSGRILFSSAREGGLGSGDLYLADAAGDRFATPHNLGAPLNGDTGEWGATLSPDETTLVFESSGRPEGLSESGDLYVSQFDGARWSMPRHLPAPINSVHSEPGPRISPEGRFLSFGSTRSGVLATYRIDLAVVLAL